MKKILQRVAATLLLIAMLTALASCGSAKKEYDPGYFTLTADNAKSFLTYKNSGTARRIDPKMEGCTFIDCALTFGTEGGGSVTVSLDSTGYGLATGLDNDAKLLNAVGTVFVDDLRAEDTRFYFEYNNVKYWNFYNFRTGIDYWEPEYTKKNNTEVLYFDGNAYTASGYPIKTRMQLVFGYYRNWKTVENVMDRVETVIVNDTVFLSDLLNYGWGSIATAMPNLKTVYVKNVIDDIGEDLNVTSKHHADMPAHGITFYISGEIDGFIRYLDYNTEYYNAHVNGIYESSELDISGYEKDNSNK